MKNRLTDLFIIVLSLLYISCDFSIADLLNEKLELTPPIYLSYKTEYGKTPVRKEVQKGDVITEEMLPELAYKPKYDSSGYYYNNGEYYYYDPSEDEQTFDGWYYDELFLDKVEVGDVIECGLTLYAKWKNANVYIYFYLQNGYLEKYSTYDYSDDYRNGKYYEYRRYGYKYKIGTELSSINLPIPYYNISDYIFQGWYLDPDYTTSAEGYVIESNVNLYAKERYNGLYSIRYTAAGSFYSNLPDKTSIQAGEKLDSNYLPELTPYEGNENYVFMGWYYDYNCSQKAQEGDEVNSDIWLYAKWEQKFVDLDYYSNYSITELPERKKVENGFILTSDYLPELTPYSDFNNYVFMGWYYDYDCNQKAQVGDEVTNNITLYAKWEQKYVDISYWSNYSFAELPESRKIEKGSTLVLDYMPELSPPSGFEDYKFIGWYYDSESNAKAQVGDVIDINITLHAIWEVKYVTIYYSTLGYAPPVYEVMNVDRDSILTEELLPELTPYSSYDNLVFAGWYYDSNYERPASIGDILSDNYIYLYAKYDVTPNGNFYENWIYDESVSDNFEQWSDASGSYNPASPILPAELQYGYYYAGEESISYDSYYYDGVEYTNGSFIKRYYVKREISSGNLAHLLSLFRAYDQYLDLSITDTNLDVEQIASILKNNNPMRCHINLYLCENSYQLTSIPENSFKDVPYLTGIFIPDSVQTIGKNAFKGCSDLTFINMYPSVTLIDEGAFEDSSLSEVYYRGSENDRTNMIIYDNVILNANWYYNW